MPRVSFAPSDARPTRLPINANQQDLETLTSRAWEALGYANEDDEFLYLHGGVISQLVKRDDSGPVIQVVKEARMQHLVARKARFFKGTGERQTPARPPKDLARDLLATPNPPLPPLERLVEVPVFAADGTLQEWGGYHRRSRTYYYPRSGFKLRPVPLRPSKFDLARANLILKDVLHDFPFASEADRANAVALCLLPFMRDLADGATPLHLIEKPKPGTGASLLAQVLTFPATGDWTPTMTEGRDEEEWRRRITSKLREAPVFVLIDNLQLRLASPALSAAITSPYWEDRILGSSTMARIPVRCIWIATGNNPALSDEIARRTIPIRLDARCPQPWRRSGFRHPDLPGFVAENWAGLVWAALVLIRAWLAADRPRGRKTLGGFERYSEAMGGVLGNAGIDGFLENQGRLHEQSQAEWLAFLAAWWDGHAERKVGVADLLPLVSALEEPLDLGPGDAQSRKVVLGKKLAANRDRHFEIATATGQVSVRLVVAGQRHNTRLWQLLEVKRP